MIGIYRQRKIIIALAITGSMLLSACSVPEAKRPRSAAPRTPPVNGVNSAAFRQCAGQLAALGALYTPLPDKSYGGGCTAYGAVRLDRISVPTTNLGPMTCPLAEKFTAWVRYAVQPAARVYFGSEVVRIDSFGTYSCRNIAGSGKLSEHAHANAVDVAAFLLADGRRISLQNGWNGDEDSRQFLRRIRDSACKRFRTVLSPDYNAAHHDHLHFDLGGRGTYCR
ncbi:MAG: extensin family protein [Sphingobium sp.]